MQTRMNGIQDIAGITRDLLFKQFPEFYSFESTFRMSRIHDIVCIRDRLLCQ